MTESSGRVRTGPKSRPGVVVGTFVRPVLLRAGIGAVLEVPGRRTGAPTRVAVVPQEVDGTWYLLSTYGVSDWVRNLRAAGRGVLWRKGKAEPFTAVEVDIEERDRVIARFRARAPKPFQRDFDLRRDLADHPAFRIVPTTEGTDPTASPRS